MTLNFAKIEKKWQERWEKNKAFEAEINEKKEKFFFTTPYPYISGSLHIGQGRAATESDIYCRYLRMKGYNVLYPMAFHISGMPVLGISQAIAHGNKEKIKLYEEYVSAYENDKKKTKKIVESFKDPQKIVDFFIPKMVEEYGQLGLSVDWRRSFNSGDAEHQKMVSWQFEKYKEKDYLLRGNYPVLYSPKDESSMGEDDIQDADANPVEKNEFTLLKFKFKKKFLVAATLRPETIFGQTNLWINPNVKYVEAKVGDEIWIISKEAVEKLSHQRRDVHELGWTKEKLIGEKAVAPLIDRELIVLPSRFVDSDVGTGIVTSVPGHAPYDYVALKELQTNKKIMGEYGLPIKEIEEIEIIPIIKTKKYGDKAAVVVVEQGKVVTQDDPRLKEMMQEVYKEEFHNGVLLENCGKYSFMSVKQAKEEMKIDLIKRNFASTMYETSRKAFSRSGGKIVVAIMNDQWFLDFNSAGWKKKASACLQKMKIIPESNRKLFEDTFNWLDKRPCARKRGLGTRLPFDENWMIESLSDSTIYMTLYTISHLVKKHKLKREQMSSEFFDYVYAGNGTPSAIAKRTKIKEKILKEFRKNFEYWMPVDHRHTFNLHLSNHLSFMIFAFAGLFNEKYWPKKITFHGLVIKEGSKMSKSKGNIITLLDAKKRFGADTFRFYMTHASNIDAVLDWRDAEAENAKSSLEKVFSTIVEVLENKKNGTPPERYVSYFNKIVKNAGEKIDSMKLREYNNLVVFDMINLVKQAKISLGEKELAFFYNAIAENWIKMISPVCPHIAEELWEKLGKKTLVSLESWPAVDEKKINDKFEKIAEAVDKAVADILNVLKIVREKTGDEAEKVYLYVLPQEREFYSEKELSTRVAKEVKIFAVNDKNKHDPENKSSKAKPGKPAIFVE